MAEIDWLCIIDFMYLCRVDGTSANGMIQNRIDWLTLVQWKAS